MEEFTDNLRSLREKVYQYLKKGRKVLVEGRLVADAAPRAAT